MIDWITAHIPCDHDPIKAGTVQSITSDGEIEWISEKHADVEGSYSAKMRVKTVGLSSGRGTMLRIDGNPAKFLQGHNLFGSDDLVGLVLGVVEKLRDLVQINPSSDQLDLISKGLFLLYRVDLTYMWELPRRDDVRSWLYALEHQARSRMGKAIRTGDTVYFGKNSRRWTIKFYGKGDEIDCKKKGHKLHSELHRLDYLNAYADNMLRGELTFRSLELEDSGLKAAQDWLNIESFWELHQSYMTRLQMSDQFSLSSSEISDLPPRIVAVYKLWKQGEDLRSLYPKKTFYRYRTALLAHGIDISIRQPHKPDNVIPLVRVIQAKPAQVPEWAKGTPLYYEPPLRKIG